MKTTGFIVSTLLALGAFHSFAVEENNVVARVGEIEVHANDVQSFVDRLPAREKEALAQDPALLSQSVRMLLAQQLVLKEACAKEWDKQPDTVKLIEKARDTVVVESYLQSVSKPDDKYPSEAEVKAAYEANKAALVVPKQFKLAQIYVEASKQADAGGQDKAKARLDAVQKSLRQGNADFGTVAKTQSDDKNSAGKGGEIGWLAERQLQPEIRAKVVNLAKNGVSEPIRMDDGWHVIKCLDIKEARQALLDEVRDQLTQQLRAERSRNLRQAYLAKIVRENPCSVNELAVSGILKK